MKFTNLITEIFKRIFVILLFIVVAAGVTAEAKFWSKQELINAGFKFGVQPSYSEVIYGKQINGKLNGIVWLKSYSYISVGYMVNGEMAAPYIEVPNDNKYNYIGIQENNYSYASSRRDPMSFIVDEIYGINSSSDSLRESLKNGNFNINNSIVSFDEFILSGQKIPTNAWEDYVEHISDIKIKNSYPEERIPEFRNELSYPQIIRCDGVYRTDRNNNQGGMYINLPSRFDMRQFTISLDFKPIEDNRTGILFSLSRRLEFFIKDGCLVIRGKYHNDLIWVTSCPIRMNDWNHIAVTYDINTLLITMNNCSKLAAFVIPREELTDCYLTSYNFSTGDNFNGMIKNILITYM